MTFVLSLHFLGRRWREVTKSLEESRLLLQVDLFPLWQGVVGVAVHAKYGLEVTFAQEVLWNEGKLTTR